jgi:hypothetical protein
MKKLYYILMVVLILAVFSTAYGQETIDTVQSAPGIKIECAVDRAEIYIGDLITYRLTIVFDSGITLTPPPIGANLGAFDVKDYQTDDEVKLKDGRIKLESRFLLTTFTTGDYVIPPIPIEYMTIDSVRKILISEPMPIKVKSLLAEAADTADIRDLKALMEFKKEIPLWYYLAGAVLLLMLIALFVWWRLRKRKPEDAEPVDRRPAWEIASEKLAMLKEKNYPAAGEIKQYYVELSEIIREFLQRIYEIPVLDMTTYEFLTEIVQREIDVELYERLKKYLQFADLVKFAKFIPQPERFDTDFDEAVSLVDYVRQSELSKTAVPIGTEMNSISGGEKTNV